jgi:hypothetical protein
MWVKWGLIAKKPKVEGEKACCSERVKIRK